ncbi:Na/Pi symporter [Zwartia sp.]|uniref:Na/Pi cotransporter family protein n=1 Tax=Zwartia sp. TaxID=2978004 RepID=UPI0027233E93|nr:Na/Pi symporter [Zwartia sp.]MDO9023219.1 Na/Pi symporter [Zwartia sp.]
MTDVIFRLVGGIGLFLIGMSLLTSGLVAFSGNALQRGLAKFTGTPSKAFLSGALLTALVQSSTATTATLIGFVSAGFITFSQAIGVVIGASFGTTATGWLVATLGLKLNLGLLTLPLIGIGALLKTLAKGRLADLGMALAGFGLLFLGLSILQEGMRTLSGLFNLSDLPIGGVGARLLVMLIGFAMTAILQSSSAAIATILTALDTGNINFDQAAALTVGAAIGTTLTGALLAIGATIHAKRTVLAHIIFNTFSGLIAIVLLPAFLATLDRIGDWITIAPGPVGLAAFHSMFIGFGVVLFLPFTVRFARLVERMLPNRSRDLTEHLDDSLLQLTDVALEASQRALEQTADTFMAHFSNLLTQQSSSTEKQLDFLHAKQSLERTFSFISRIHLPAGDDAHHAQRIAQLHAVDHLIRLRNRLQDITQVSTQLGQPIYLEARTILISMLHRTREGLARHTLTAYIDDLAMDARAVAALSTTVRDDVLKETGPGISHDLASDLLHLTDAMRWLERTAQHISRICHYLALGRPEKPLTASEPVIVDRI